MSRESDKKLLAAFASWWCNEGFEDMGYRITANTDAFLAAREPPATEQRYWRVKEHPGWHAVEQFYDEQGRLHTKPLSTELRATEADARAEGEATGLPEWTSAAVPVSQGPRYWKIHRAYRTNGNIAWECDGHGKMLCRLTPVCGTHSAGRDTLAEAEADGRASGLPEYQPDAIPAALPTDVTVPARGK